MFKLIDPLLLPLIFFGPIFFMIGVKASELPYAAAAGALMMGFGGGLLHLKISALEKKISDNSTKFDEDEKSD